MAKQLEVVKFRDIIRANTISKIIPGLPNPTLEIFGEDFSSVESILINDLPSPEFFIVSKTTVWVELPVNAGPIDSIVVLSSDFTKTAEASSIQFKIGSKTKTVEGILKLTQLFTKWLLQSPGTDIFNMSRGGGLQDIVGQVTSAAVNSPVLGAIARAVDKTTQEIRTAQNSVGRLPLNERLLSASLLDVGVLPELQEARARVQVDSVAGQRAISTLSL
jgi:K+-transporting ATPase c subunit